MPPHRESSRRESEVPAGELPTEEKETILGSKTVVDVVLLLSFLVIVLRLYFRWLLARNGYRPPAPLTSWDKGILGLAALAFLLNAIALLGGKQLVRKMRDKSFARKFQWIDIAFLVGVLYFLFPWPWWLVAAAVLTPIALAIDSRRFARIISPGGADTSG